MKPKIFNQELFSESEIEFSVPPITDLFVVAAFYKPQGYDGYWSVFRESFTNKEKAEQYCKTKMRSNWLCFKIFNLKDK